MVVLKVKRLSDRGYLPIKINSCDAGWDLRSAEDIVLENGSTTVVSTAIAIEYPEGYWGQIEGRSGMASKGIFPTGGIVDNGYRGEHRIILVNLSGGDYRISRGDKIAQLVLRSQVESIVEEVDNISDSDRGDAGFGSSGR
jgi:dUTP pyrophosphatase